MSKKDSALYLASILFHLLQFLDKVTCQDNNCKNAAEDTVACRVREQSSRFFGTFLHIRSPSICSLKREREEGKKEKAIPSVAGALLRSNSVKQLKVTNHRQTVFVFKIHGFVEGQWFKKVSKYDVIIFRKNACSGDCSSCCTLPSYPVHYLHYSLIPCTVLLNHT